MRLSSTCPFPLFFLHTRNSLLSFFFLFFFVFLQEWFESRLGLSYGCNQFTISLFTETNSTKIILMLQAWAVSIWDMECNRDCLGAIWSYSYGFAYQGLYSSSQHLVYWYKNPLTFFGASNLFVRCSIINHDLEHMCSREFSICFF